MENEIQPTQEVTPPVLSPTKSKKTLLLVLLGLILITVSVYVGIQIGKRQVTNEQNIAVQPTTKPPQAVVDSTDSLEISEIDNTSTDPTLDWKTYDMPSYSVKAPQQLQSRKGEGEIFNDLLMLSESYPLGKTPEKGIDISFGFISNNECVTNQDCFDNYNKSVKGGELTGSKTITTYISTTISEQKVNGFRHLDYPSDTSNLTIVRIIYPICYNENLFQIEFDAFGKSELEINQYLDSLNIDQIVSSFKFVN